MKEIYLYQLSREVRFILSLFLIVLSIGVSVGLIFLFHTTSFSKSATTERLIESTEYIEEDFGIDESKSRSTGEILMTTHNHIIGFTLIFFFVGGIFYFNSTIQGFWKIFLISEPFVSTFLSFGSMLAVRFWGEYFIYITIISACLIYLSYFIMVVISLYELNLKSRV
jgi:hypothetical protein